MFKNMKIMYRSDHETNIQNLSVLSVFQIVKFKNGDCPASDGNRGVCFTGNFLLHDHLPLCHHQDGGHHCEQGCYPNHSLCKAEGPTASRKHICSTIDNFLILTEAECSSKGGVASGSCASGFGVCCVCK